MKGYRTVRLMLAVTVVALSGIQGCGAIGGQKSPDQLLSLAVSGLKAADQFRFSGRAETRLAGGLTANSAAFRGEMNGHDTLRLTAVPEKEGEAVNMTAEIKTDTAAYDPVALLDRLEHLDKTVGIENGKRFAGRSSTLIVEIAPDAAKRELEERLRREFEQAVGGGGAASKAGNKSSKASPARDTKSGVEEAEQAEVVASRAKLESMLRTLAVSTQYRIEVDRRRNVPRSIEGSTVYRYEAMGGEREERSTIVYRFETFGG